jgi:YD repeat-containing protein
VVLLCCVLSAAGQQQYPSMEKGFQAEKLYQFGDVDNVNIFNGNLIIGLPIGLSYPLDGGLSYQLRLSYNSKAWDMDSQGPRVRARPSDASNAGMGWIFGLGRFIPSNDPRNTSLQNLYEGPDGSNHAFLGDRTYDGSNLRLRLSTTVADIDFPDGVIHHFEKNSSLNEWQLKTIAGPLGSASVSIQYVDTCGLSSPCPLKCANFDSAWTITDSTRTHYACFRNHDVDGEAMPMVEKIVVSSAPSNAYLFTYTDNTNIQKPPEDTGTTNDWRQTHSAPLLTTVTLPDGSSYVMTSTGGFMSSLTLPTLGKISYTYDVYTIPSQEFCSNNYGPGLGFGAKTTGVTRRTLTSVVPGGQPAQSREWKYEPVLLPGPATTAYMSASTCPSSDPNDNLPVKVQLFDEMVVTVTDPLGNKVANHFSVFPGADVNRFPDPDTSPAGFQRKYYGWPYGRYDAAQNRYLSQEIFRCLNGSCTPLRSIWVRHEADTDNPIFTQDDAEGPHRLVSQRTVFHDDPGGCTPEGYGATCLWTQGEWTDWDHYGHYRQTANSSNFGASDLRVATTSWNKIGGVQRTIGSSDKWILSTYEDSRVDEGTAFAVEQACFETTTGVLRGKRTLLGLSPGAKDLAVVFLKDSNGNLGEEKYYGGDSATLSTAPSLCSVVDGLANTPPEYRITHTWQNGRMATSQAGGMPYKSLDLTVNGSGLVTASRDTSNLATNYSYDVSGRLTSVAPPGMAATTYTYSNAAAANGALTSPAKVVASTVPASGGEVAQVYQYDSFGRLWREKHLMPDGNWSVTEMRSDALDRRDSISTPQSLAGVTDELALVPTYKTTFAYDALGRTTRVTPPDSSGTDPKSVRTTYTGARQVTRTVTTATASGPADVSVVETYDGQGRLIAVLEGGVTTEYTYDIGGRLETVSTTTAAGTQTRSFSYDNRGFLLSEQHPELGSSGYGEVSYSEYDSRGHAHRRTTGTFDIRMTFDSAERITAVTEIGVTPNRLLKQFQYDNGGGLANGRLTAAARYNHDSVFGTIAVTESYQYDAAGRPARRDRAVGAGTGLSGQTFAFSQTYNDLGEVESLTYPCTTTASCERQRTVTNLYTHGALTGVSGWAGITYQPNGLIATVTHGSGNTAIAESWSADPWGLPRPQKISSTNAAGTELWSTGVYGYDGAGNISKKGTTTYRYDAFQRLTGWTDAPTGSLATANIVYDELGNQLYTTGRSCTRGSNGLFSCADNSVLANVVAGTTNHFTTLTYDDAGSVLSDGYRTFSYDALGMMTRAITTDARDFHYLYTIDDERIAVIERKATGNKTTWTVRDFANRALSMWTDTTTGSTRTIAWKEDTIWRGGSLLANVTPTATPSTT